MKHLLTLLAWSGCLASSLPAQTLTFTRTYGGSNGYDDARSIVPTSDGGFVFTGLCQSAADPAGDLYLTKVNAAGSVLWTKYYPRTEEDGGNHLLATRDGGYLITGHTALSYGINCDGYVVKTDAEGNLQWYALVGMAFDDVCDAAVELEDGSYLVAGRTEESSSHTFRVLLAKISAKGQVIFTRALPADQPEIAYAMTRAADGHLLLAGYTTTNGGNTDQMLLLKCTTEGQVIWRQHWQSGDWAERAHALAALPDGGCVVVGGGHDATEQPTQMVAARFDATGRRFLNSLLISDLGLANLTAVQLTTDGRLAVAGTLQRPGEAYAQPCVAWLDENLGLLDWRTVALPAQCRTRCLTLTANNDCIIAGQMGAEAMATNIFLAKIAGPSATTAVQDVATTPLLLFPNPCHEQAYLKVGTPGIRKTLILYDVAGGRAAEWTFDGDEYLIQRALLRNGTYFFTVRDAQGQQLATGQLAFD